MISLDFLPSGNRLIFSNGGGESLKASNYIYSITQWDEFLYICIKIQRGVEGREGRMEELTQSGNKTITRGVISWSKKEIFLIFRCHFLVGECILERTVQWNALIKY